MSLEFSRIENPTSSNAACQRLAAAKLYFVVSISSKFLEIDTRDSEEKEENDLGSVKAENGPLPIRGEAKDSMRPSLFIKFTTGSKTCSTRRELEV